LRRVSLYFVIREAFALHDYQISGPDWLKDDKDDNDERYDIQATAPAGTPRPQILQMLQSLLQDRFQLTFHSKSEEGPILALTLRPGAPPLKDISQAAPATNSSPTPDGTLAMDQAGNPTFTIHDQALGRYRFTPHGTVSHYEFESITMSAMERFLNSSYLDRPVLNRTGLTGSYALTIDVPLPASVTGNNDPTGYSVEDSLQKQGLQLTRQRGPVEQFVIDRISKEPTEN
jgi:uncharacterized protein (TIGR03435 family)